MKNGKFIILLPLLIILVLLSSCVFGANRTMPYELPIINDIDDSMVGVYARTNKLEDGNYVNNVNDLYKLEINGLFYGIKDNKNSTYYNAEKRYALADDSVLYIINTGGLAGNHGHWKWENGYTVINFNNSEYFYRIN